MKLLRGRRRLVALLAPGVPITAGASVLAAAASLGGCGQEPTGLPVPMLVRVEVARGLQAQDIATGFLIRTSRVVTVAHVLGVEGRAARVRVWAPGRGRREFAATVTTIDERDDVALLAVPGLRGAAARTGTVVHGTRLARTGTVVHGARLARTGTVVPDALVLAIRDGHVQLLAARVQRPVLARIRTPVGGQLVRRPALELRADILPGDSGAPVLSGDGRIAGVIFARADARPRLAYAVDASVLGRL